MSKGIPIFKIPNKKTVFCPPWKVGKTEIGHDGS